MATVDYFIKLTDIKGESTDKVHKDEIDVESWSWGATQSGTFSLGGGGGAGKVSMNDFNFVCRTNKSSPALMFACASGKHIKEALFTARKAGGKQQEFLKVKLSDVLISSYQTGGSSEVPMDQITLNFSKIEVSYAPQKPDGSLDAYVTNGWNLKENQKV
ncbi:MAG TPA: type VI secretion system tube protein Hcp [Gemmatimonadaceae bacterium]|nr:type VI secretion system tube protein Hcp [Gemmatimonadaceae bacterium]